MLKKYSHAKEIKQIAKCVNFYIICVITRAKYGGIFYMQFLCMGIFSDMDNGEKSVPKMGKILTKKKFSSKFIFNNFPKKFN